MNEKLNNPKTLKIILINCKKFPKIPNIAPLKVKHSYI